MPADEEIAVVESRGGHADEDFVGAGLGFGIFFDLEAAELANKELG